jgi:hydroxymethylpyrimidine/phosphomethylpyrimidine kinase
LVRAGLLAQVGWITPNVDELAVLAQVETVTRESIPQAARKLQSIAEGVGNPDLWVVVTGGHLDTPDDYLLAPGGEGIWLPGTWVATTSTHGTGCAFSSALVCQLIRGKSSIDAATAAKDYVTRALRAAYPVGKGRGPMHHLYRFDADQTR